MDQKKIYRKSASEKMGPTFDKNGPLYYYFINVQ